ncbi:toxin secretion ATP binding protein [Legionella lansingensis]|uniref:Toxin secretion ATP binding protein n=1 Tax=Legionella lansingensis TaxID=45067 RepID=A0A0W0W004_9GAMM|nr:type I secretion system permease/ATPase [Legionella lansingensis]KTD25486.1 toxin secretion ATP binding protein [Legionella lansingensis]SNV51536.1 toxin secretion ATP binding protein [Legionella lansingensis]
MAKKQPQGLLKETFQSSKSAYLYVGFFSLFINILMLTVPIYMMQIFDRVLSSHSYETLFYLTLIAVLALLALSLLDAVRTHILIHISTWFDRKVTPVALAMSPDQLLQGNPYPEQTLRDIATIRQFLGGSSIFTFFDAPWVPIYLLVIFLIDPILGICSTIGAIILFACALINELATNKALEKANDIAISNNLETTATLRNAEVIQAMGMSIPLIKQWYANNEKVLLFQTKSSQISGNILSFSKFLRLSLQILILGAGAYLVLTHEITSGMMIAASILMSRALAPVEQAIAAWKQFQSFQLAKKRLEPHFLFNSGRTSGLRLPKPKGAISIENVYYSPPNLQKFIINNVNQQIRVGEMVALIGASAAGKSTLARLIVGILKPSSGTVRLDNADVYQWERDDFGQHVGYLPQDIELFAGTVKDNIARMGEVDDAAVIKAAQLAGCHDMILRLGNGYDTLIHREGFQISGGQRQRIALARALYKDPQLVVFDEPNSNLDGEGENALINALETLKKRGVTVIIIAHRPSIIRFVDTIIVLNEGKVQFSGPRDQILAKLRELAKTSMPKPQEGISHG